jgi:hypothetical protein
MGGRLEVPGDIAGLPSLLPQERVQDRTRQGHRARRNNTLSPRTQAGFQSRVARSRRQPRRPIRLSLRVIITPIATSTKRSPRARRAGCWMRSARRSGRRIEANRCAGGVSIPSKRPGCAEGQGNVHRSTSPTADSRRAGSLAGGGLATVAVSPRVGNRL